MYLNENRVETKESREETKNRIHISQSEPVRRNEPTYILTRK